MILTILRVSRSKLAQWRYPPSALLVLIATSRKTVAVGGFLRAMELRTLGLRCAPMIMKVSICYLAVQFGAVLLLHRFRGAVTLASTGAENVKPDFAADTNRTTQRGSGANDSSENICSGGLDT